MLLNVLEELRNGDLADVLQCLVLDIAAAAADGRDHAVRKEKTFSGNAILLSTCDMEVMFLTVTEMPSVLSHNFTRPPWAKLAHSSLKLPTILLTAR